MSGKAEISEATIALAETTFEMDRELIGQILERIDDERIRVD